MPSTLGIIASSAWKPMVATGGDTVTDVTIDGVTYRVHQFTTVGSASFTVTEPGTLNEVEYLIVGGGGGAGGDWGGGGGAGGFRLLTATVDAGSFSVIVGSGGLGGIDRSTNPTEGSSSSFYLESVSGGGRGGARASGALINGGNGGSGGGGSANNGTGGLGNTPPTSPSQGENGGSGGSLGCGGGGGAGGVGSSGSGAVGGNGATSDITGTQITYAGGGAGGNQTTVISGGSGGGGNSAIGSGTGSNGTNGLGGGGGGCGSRGTGGDGGSGIVIIRYPITDPI